MKNKVIVGIIAISALGVAAYSSASAFGWNGQGKPGPNYTPERHEQMTRAFESNDYQAWKNLMGERGPARFVTEEEFPKFSEMHKLMLEGKIEEANKIRQELGIGQGMGQRRGNGNGMMRGESRRGNFVDNNGDGRCDNM